MAGGGYAPEGVVARPNHVPLGDDAEVHLAQGPVAVARVLPWAPAALLGKPLLAAYSSITAQCSLGIDDAGVFGAGVGGGSPLGQLGGEAGMVGVEVGNEQVGPGQLHGEVSQSGVQRFPALGAVHAGVHQQVPLPAADQVAVHGLQGVAGQGHRDKEDVWGDFFDQAALRKTDEGGKETARRARVEPAESSLAGKGARGGWPWGAGAGKFSANWRIDSTRSPGISLPQISL